MANPAGLLSGVKQMGPVFHDPIGTLREVKQLKLSLVRTASCSRPSKSNKGCPHYDHAEHGPCPVLSLLQQRGRPGVEFVAWMRVRSATSWKQDATMCHHYMSTLHFSDQRNGVVRILGFGGDVTIKRRGTKEHPTNPRARIPDLSVERIPRYERPTVTLKSIADMNELAAQMAIGNSAESAMAALGFPGGGIAIPASKPDADGSAHDDDRENERENELGDAMDQDLEEDVFDEQSDDGLEAPAPDGGGVLDD